MKLNRTFAASLACLVTPGLLLAHEPGGLHMHPHGVEWLPALVVAALTAGVLYTFRRVAR